MIPKVNNVIDIAESFYNVQNRVGLVKLNNPEQNNTEARGRRERCPPLIPEGREGGTCGRSGTRTRENPEPQPNPISSYLTPGSKAVMD
ncbi:hypothetical protein E2562_021107 [Oryza meyeriana var. granulata]|uniref:Uncharacterized protein n=1 Tax=Oryza meyeriana var. granulata TaxID=110450 RepID=A0A6G1BMM3_9ORYZ|nr:hypothetical protein E2562_021107 [Oryza meyeriana var. granulata]